MRHRVEMFGSDRRKNHQPHPFVHGIWISDVVGPICESGDFLAKDRMLPFLESGDLVALLTAGAYGFTMSSQYNARPRVPEVMVKGRRFEVVRERETYQDLIKGERIPAFLR